MKFGCVVESRLLGAIPDFPQRLAELGCEGVYWRDGIWRAPCDEPLSRVCGRMRDAGLSIIGVGGLRLDGVGQGSAASVMAELSAVGEAVVVTGSPREAGSPAVCQAALDALVPEAGKRGLGLYVTNEAGTCFEQLDALRALFTPARSGTLRFLLDVGAFYQAAVNPRDAWAEFAGQTGCVVVSDLQAGRRVPLGAGSVNVAGLLGDVVNEGYAGWSAADPPGANAASWLEGLRHDVRFIRERVDVL